MANEIVVTAAQVAVVFPEQAEIYNVKLAEAVTKGVALYQTTSGTYGIADANAAGKEQFRGVALEAANAGEGISMLKRGILAGYTLATYDDEVYLSDTAGAFSTVPGTLLVKCGRVMSLADPALTEVLYIEADWLCEWGNAAEVP
ncbi:MAG TPA: hypothetical protein VM537_07635 [Anaerolineae bacterium]|nr:hypothetical protein [Anaerolineae bacterium]